MFGFRETLSALCAIATALYDTIEDVTLPNHLRKVQLKVLLDYIEALKSSTILLEDNR